MSWKWFGTKTVYRWEAKGKPSCVDSSYDRGATLVEERTVIVRARNVDEAIAKSEKEANSYCSNQRFKNCYGESISIRYLKCCDVVELFDEPEHGVEVHSNNFITDKKVSDKSIVDRFLGKPESKRQKGARYRFMNADLVNEFALK